MIPWSYISLLLFSLFHSPGPPEGDGWMDFRVGEHPARVNVRFAPGPGVLLSVSFSSCTEDVLLAQYPCAVTLAHNIVLWSHMTTTRSWWLFLCFFFLWDFSFASVFIARALLVVGACSCACSTCSLTISTVWSLGSPPGPVSYYLFRSLHARRMFYLPQYPCAVAQEHNIVLCSHVTTTRSYCLFL